MYVLLAGRENRSSFVCFFSCASLAQDTPCSTNLTLLSTSKHHGSACNTHVGRGHEPGLIARLPMNVGNNKQTLLRPPFRVFLQCPLPCVQRCVRLLVHFHIFNLENKSALSTAIFSRRKHMRCHMQIPTRGAPRWRRTFVARSSS